VITVRVTPLVGTGELESTCTPGEWYTVAPQSKSKLSWSQVSCSFLGKGGSLCRRIDIYCAKVYGKNGNSIFREKDIPENETKPISTLFPSDFCGTCHHHHVHNIQTPRQNFGQTSSGGGMVSSTFLPADTVLSILQPMMGNRNPAPAK